MKLQEERVDAIVDAAMRAFEAPGMAIAIVRDGEVVLSKGYGVRELGRPERVTPQTVFAIASCTKAYTSTAIAMLVDEKKMAWDDPVRKHIPFFRFTDPNSDHNATITDLLSHRTGLPRNDALWYGSDISREEIVRRACLLDITHTLRSNYEYNNLMYTAAGYALGEASGLGYEGFIRKRIFEPLGMSGAVLSVVDAQAAPDHASPHAFDKDRKAHVIPWRNLDNVCPTGGINAGVEDLAKWVTFQLACGAWKGERLVSEENLTVTRTPAIISVISDEAEMPTIATYAMGWEVFDQMGVKVLAHSGGIDGYGAQTVLLPRLNTGFAILCNCGRPAATAVRRALIAYLGGFEFSKDPLQRTIDEETKANDDREKAFADFRAKRSSIGLSLPLEAYAGTFSEPAYGEAEFAVAGGELKFIFNGHTYACEHFHQDIFLLHAPWPQMTESPDTITFAIGLDGTVESARWRIPESGIDRLFRR